MNGLRTGWMDKLELLSEIINSLEYQVVNKVVFSTEQFCEFRNHSQQDGNAVITRTYRNYNIVCEYEATLFGIPGWSVFVSTEDRTMFVVYLRCDGCIYLVGNTDNSNYNSAYVLDLDRRGKRWEGPVYCGLPWGWGMLFDENDHLLYFGYMIGDQKVCYGTMYYPDIEREFYCGMIHNNRKHGFGKLMDRLGNVEKEGEWLEDRPCTSTLYCSLHAPIHHLHTRLRFITIFSKVGFPATIHQFSLEHYSVVERIELGSGCLQHIDSFSLNDLQSLRVLLVRSYAFSPTISLPSSSTSGQLGIWNCPCLKEITIERNACLAWNKLSILNTSSLQSIRFGGWNFGGEMRLLQLDSLPSLKQLYVGELCFTNIECIHLSTLSQLEVIGMGRGSFVGIGNSSLRILGNNMENCEMIDRCSQTKED